MYQIKQFFKLMKTKRKLLLILVYMICIIGATLITYRSEYLVNIPANELHYMKSIDPEMGLDFFYMLHNSGIVLLIFFLINMIIPNIITSDFLKYKQNKFDYLMINRIKHKSYYRDCQIFNFIITFIISILTELLILLTIEFFCFHISFDINPIYAQASRDTTLFSQSLLFNLCIYIVLSAIGYGVFSNFIFSLQFKIKNIYLYRTLGIMIALVSSIGSASLSVILVNLNSNTILPTLAYFFNIANITTPGIVKSVVLYNTPFLFYIGTLGLYLLITHILFGLKEKADYQYG